MRASGHPRSASRWRREGLVLSPLPSHSWWTSHAQAPTILPLSDRLWRIYFAARDEVPRARILCADADPRDGMRLLRLHPDPVLELGAEGAFDSHGMAPSTVRAASGRIHLYYTGIVRRTEVPYRLAIGHAVSEDGGLSFQRVSPEPIFTSGPCDPLFVTMPCVRAAALGGLDMWYASGVEWRQVAERMEPFYELRHSRSADGGAWDRRTRLALGLEGVGDAGLTRPWLLDCGGDRRVWYSRRGWRNFREPGKASYRIHQAILGEDGFSIIGGSPLKFENPPRTGEWDGWMQAYACVHPLGNDLVMLYNGDDFGRAGFGWARLAGGARQETA